MPALETYLTNSQSAEIFLNQQKIGFVGQIKPLIAQKYRISEPVFATQISLTKVFTYLEKFSVPAFYQPLSNFPRSEKDLSFVFPITTNYQQVIQTIKKLGGENLREVKIFDVYQNTELEKQEKKSISLHLVFQSFVRTLEAEEVEKVVQRIGKKVENLFQAKLRVKGESF